MNNADRKELETALNLIEQAREILETIKDSEQDKFDNLGDNLQQSEKGQRFEENVSALDDALSSLDDAVNSIDEASQ